MSRYVISVLTVILMFGVRNVEARAQQLGGDPQPHRDAMKRAGFLVGEWSGDGWFATPTGRQEIRQFESVRYELGGTILVIEGTARAREGTQVGEILFNAYAVISWSEDRGYEMQSYLWSGLKGTRQIEFSDNGFTWKQGSEAGPVTYAMELTVGGEWYEIGKLERGSETYPVVEFRLRRQ